MYNEDVLKKTLIAKFFITIAIILLIFSSYVMNYVPESQAEAIPLKYILGTIVNSYIINAGIILAYVLIYRNLKTHYSKLDQQYKAFIPRHEREDMLDTLSSLRIFFTCICQCFLYRIIQRIIIEVFYSTWVSSPYMATIVKNLYFLSEMIMIIGICISIKRSVDTAKVHKSQKQNMNS